MIAERDVIARAKRIVDGRALDASAAVDSAMVSFHSAHAGKKKPTSGKCSANKRYARARHCPGKVAVNVDPLAYFVSDADFSVDREKLQRYRRL